MGGREGGRDDAKLINEKQDLDVLTTHEWCHETCPYLSLCGSTNSVVIGHTVRGGY